FVCSGNFWYATCTRHSRTCPLFPPAARLPGEKMKFPQLLSHLLLAAAVAAASGCAKTNSTPPLAAANEAPQTQQAAPFASTQAGDAQPKAESKSLVPQEVIIPSGTAITVRL